jgi:hypothetical protein
MRSSHHDGQRIRAAAKTPPAEKAVPFPGAVRRPSFKKGMTTETMAKLSEDFLATLCMLGFNIYGGEVAEMKGEMSIKVLRPCSSELKFNFVLTLTSHQEIVFTLEDADIIATTADNNCGGAPSGARLN